MQKPPHRTSSQLVTALALGQRFLGQANELRGAKFHDLHLVPGKKGVLHMVTQMRPEQGGFQLLFVIRI